MQIDLELLLRAAQMAGALSGNTPLYGVKELGSKEANLTLSTMASMYGPNGLFHICGDNDLLSLTIEPEPFLDWLGWKPNNESTQLVKLISYIGPEGTAGGSPTGGTAAACDDPSGVEFGTCEILLPDKGRIKRAGPVRDITENNRRVCDQYPLYFKDGRRIEHEIVWSLTLAGVALRQDLKRMVVAGNSNNANEFAGLQQLVNTGYKNVHDGRRCSAMDSIVIDWGGNDMSTGPNGVHGLVDYLIDIVRRIRQRAMWANLGNIAVGDMVLMMPSFLRDCLLDAFTCWSVCPGRQYNEANLNTFEARTFRNTLNGGQYGMGQIFVDGTPVPIITYDWQSFGQVGGAFTGDIYVLTRRIGNVPVLWGQYIDMTDPAQAFAEEAGYMHYRAVDGGRFLTYWKTDNECTQAVIVMRPNVYLSAPWAQARIASVACQRPLPPLSPDPTSDYYAEEYLVVATAPEDYLVPSI
ncbi:MAG TPA: hypothetical protein G4O02_13375 [Caldilineae bacterium]|nr:hypothetical protein [Caldilineae bacterium]